MSKAVTDDAGLGPELEDIEASDPSDTIQHARVIEILDERRRVKEKKAEAYEDVELGVIKPEGKDRIIRNAVEDYIRELLHTMSSTETEVDYLYGIELGEVALPTRAVTFEGLVDILNAPNPLRDTWQETSLDEYSGRTTEERIVLKPIPEDILMNAYDACNMFCEEIGLDVRTEQASTVVAGFDYSDLIKENDGGD